MSVLRNIRALWTRRAIEISSGRIGFSLIELMITVGIIALIGSSVILFNSQGRDELLLAVEQAKMAQTVLRAKTLAISAYGNGTGSASFPAVCGFGVHFNYPARSYEIFQWNNLNKGACRSDFGNPNDPIVSTGDLKYTLIGTPNVLASAFALGGAVHVRDIFFMPPDPMTNVWVIASGITSTTTIGTLQISTKVKKPQTLFVTVTSAGQVTP